MNLELQPHFCDWGDFVDSDSTQRSACKI